jgi:purine-nucleoside phosphorylase
MSKLIPTPHIEAKENDIAKTVLMPGDPRRAKFIADTFLENPVMFNNVRGMLGYTGTYKGRKISVMGSGMGMPSIGIYSFELYKFYDVENIIRIGSCGAYTPEYDLYDVVLAKDAWSESTYAKTQNGYDAPTIEPTKELNDQLQKNC